MTLTDAILNNNPHAVEQLITVGHDVDAVDVYGFTPLVEAAIANNADMAALLIAHNADVNKGDITGRVALHWAVENNNLEFCKLLLDNGADANAYTVWGQPVLVNPVLRNQDKLKELLYEHGADLDFAQDYINAKLIGHQFELQGQVHIVNNHGKFIPTEFEGFILEFSVSMILESLKRFKYNFAAKKLSHYFDYFQYVIDAFAIAAELIRYQQYTTDINSKMKRINELLKNDLLLIPTAYQGHAISFVHYGKYFAKCDRGENSQFEATVMIYKITNPQAMSAQFIKELIYKKHDDEFMHNGVNKILGLTPVIDIPLRAQLSGNCSWANTEAAIPTMLLLLMMRHSGQDALPIVYRDTAMDLFAQWKAWDQDRALAECMQIAKGASEARMASKVAILASILFQRCHYQNPTDLERAEKILKLLSQPKFEYILRSYHKIYSDKYPSAAGRNLENILDLSHH